MLIQGQQDSSVGIGAYQQAWEEAEFFCESSEHTHMYVMVCIHMHANTHHINKWNT